MTAHFVIACQRVRPEVAGPMTGSAKQSSAAPGLDCFAPRNDEFVSPDLMRRHSCSRISKRPTTETAQIAVRSHGTPAT